MDVLAKISGLFWCKIHSLNRPPGEVVTEVCYECPPAPSSASLYLALEIVLKRLENAQVSVMDFNCELSWEHAEPNHISGDMAQIVTIRQILDMNKLHKRWRTIVALWESFKCRGLSGEVYGRNLRSTGKVNLRLDQRLCEAVCQGCWWGRFRGGVVVVGRIPSREDVKRGCQAYKISRR